MGQGCGDGGWCVRQSLYKRLEQLEERSAATRRAQAMSDLSPELHRLEAIVDAWAVDPRLEKLLAEAPPDFLHNRVRELRAQLMAGACSQ